MSVIRMRFATDAQAESALKNAGFSIGRNQRSDPRGIMFGDFDIQKWRNLSSADKKSLDGDLVRLGPPGSPATVVIRAADHIPAGNIISVVEKAEREEAP